MSEPVENTETTEITVQREEMEADVVIVGGGSAGLSCAIHLKRQIDAHNQAITDGKSTANPIADPMIIVLEKASEFGAHSLSGAVLNPIALKELFPNYKELDCPIDSEVTKEAFYYLGQSMTLRSPIIPPPFHNKGNYILSVSKLNRWLAQQAEALGINLFAGFTAAKVLLDGDKVIGVQTGDRGLDKNGNPKENFEPGMIIKSKLTIFADGTRSPLLKRVSEKLGLREGRDPEVFELGCKEIIQMPPGTVEAGQVIHTLGFPVRKGVGGTFIYTLKNDQIVVGLCMYLDTKDPLLDVHKDLQRFKTHPFMQKLLKDGQVITYGGKTLPAGGWFSMSKLYHHGMMACGDTVAMVDVKKLKGIHLAMKSGMLAAETAVEALAKGDFSADTLKTYDDRVNNSYIKKELWKTRNFHPVISRGMFKSMPAIGWQEITGGGFRKHIPVEHPDFKTTKTIKEVWGDDATAKAENQLPTPDNKLFFDKLSSVYMTGTMHEEDSPSHLKVQDNNICETVCYPNYNSPCNHFCPANVYEMIEDGGKKRLQVNFTNCIHCQSCDIKCPFDNIDWTLPEAGGPNYKEV